MVKNIPKGHLAGKAFFPGAVLKPEVKPFKGVHNQGIDAKTAKCGGEKPAGGPVHLRDEHGFTLEIKVTDILRK